MSRLETNTDTIIALRGFVSNALAFRLPASQFATFHALEQAAYAAFDIEPDAFTLHLHLRRREEGSCERQDGRYVLDETGWEHGVDVGGEQGVWAHFVIRDSRRRPRRALNQDATTVYPLCMPISKQRYADTRYFARETVFIPVPGAGARKCLFPPRIAEPFPGFRGLAMGTGKEGAFPQVSRRDESQERRGERRSSLQRYTAPRVDEELEIGIDESDFDEDDDIFKDDWMLEGSQGGPASTELECVPRDVIVQARAGEVATGTTDHHAMALLEDEQGADGDTQSQQPGPKAEDESFNAYEEVWMSNSTRRRSNESEGLFVSE